jgi:hypothetical protein
MPSGLEGIWIETGTPVYLRTKNIKCSSSVTNQYSTITDYNITINNSVGTGLSTSLLSLNQTNTNGILYTEKYNQKTAGSGTTILESYYAKTGTIAKLEYARTSVNTPVSTNPAAATSQYTIAVTQGGVMTNYLSCNSNNQSVDCYKTLNMSTQSITNIVSASTINSSYLAPQKVEFLTSNSSTPTGTIDANQRQVYINNGVADSFKTINGSISPWSIPTCAENDNILGITMVGTQDGHIFYTSDSGNTWTQYPFQFNGRINQILHIGGGMNIIVGQFTQCDIQLVNYACYINNWSNYAQPYQWSNYPTSNGFNNHVNCVEQLNGYLYFGGNFTGDNNNTVSTPYLAIRDTGGSLYSVDVSYAGVNNVVNCIKNDTNNSGHLIIGGQFTSFTYASGNYTCYYLIYWNVGSSGGYTTSSSASIYSLNNYPLTISQLNSDVLVGGLFTNALGGSSQYAFKMSWNGSSYSFVDWFYNPSYPINIIYNSPNNNHIYSAENGGSYALWKDGNLLGNSPSGAWSVVIYNQFSSGIDWFATTSGSSDPYPFYYFYSSDNIVVSLNNPVWYDGTQYLINFQLSSKGRSVELIWNTTDNCWYVIGYTLAIFS